MREKTLTPSTTDIHIGQRIQLRRTMMGLSQKDLANMCGITFQQIQKYESAGNRVSASRLFEISVALATPISFFFFGLDGYVEERRSTSRQPRGVAEPSENDPLSKNESLQLINLYWKLPTDAQREIIMKLLKSLNNIE